MSAPLRVLLVWDSATEAERVTGALSAAGHAIESVCVDTARAMRVMLLASRFDLVISDWSLRDFSARAALAILAESGHAIPLIVVSEPIGEEKAVEAMRAGADDFVLATRLERLAPAVERALVGRDARSSQEHVVQARKLEAVGRLAAGVAHDFSNLLSVIMSYTDLAIADLGRSDPLYGDLVEIRRAAQRATSLTGQLLAFGRRQIVQPHAIRLDHVLAGMEEMIRRLIGEDVELTVHGEAGLRLVKIDPGQIEQVVMNLVVNARDAMPHGGRLIVETGNVELDERDAAAIQAAAGPHVMLAVTDSGSGIDSAIRGRIFEPFFTTKEKGKGTGLGLSTVLGIVQQSGGTLSVESTPGVGTVFRIYWSPVEGTGDDIAVVTTSVQPVDVRGCETILLVEDDVPLRALAHEILHRHGYHVLEATGAGDALLICEQHSAPIDLLLTDVVMPRIDGKQLADRLRPLRPDMRLLYMTGYTEDEMRNCGVLDSGALLLRKPITPAALARKVREALDHGTRAARNQPIGDENRRAT
jgi:two-component system, cell cycle sensor histidine kinase and response regulator CckA